jgi:tetratricopeptide (TPR) repeat protein
MGTTGNGQGDPAPTEVSAQSVGLAALSADNPEALQAWAQERLDALGAENAAVAVADAPFVLQGLQAFWSGDFAAVDEVLASAAALLGEGPWTDEVTARVVLQRSLAGVVASLRGRFDDAEQHFVAALELDGGAPVDEARVTALSMRAAFCSEGKPDRAFGDVARARELSVALGAADLSTIAAVGEGWALSELGRFSDAARVLRDAVATLPGGLERAVTQLRWAEVQLRMGDRAGARKTVDGARTTFLDVEARYWGARAALLTGAIDRDRGGRWLKLARELSLPDPAYERLFLPAGKLRIDVSASPSVHRDGEPVGFLTRHAEATVRLLALAGEAGVTSQELINIFWPDVPVDRQRARLRTLLWQARNSLGADAWRVQRKRDQVFFDGAGVEIVGSRTKASIICEFPSRRTLG